MMDETPTRDDDLARLAELVAWVGFAGAVSLALMFAIEVPRKGPYVFGLINDVSGGVFNLAQVPLLVRLARTDDAPGWRLLSTATIAGSLASSASSFLLVARILPFLPSSIISTAAIAVQAAWIFGVGTREKVSHVLSPATRRTARLIGIGSLAGFPLAGLGALLPKKSVPRTVVLGLGVAVGGAAWAAVPVFWLLVGRTLARRASLSR